MRLIPNFGGNTPTKTTETMDYQSLFNSEFLDYSLKFFYKRLFRDCLLLNFKGKEHFDLGLFGVAKQKKGTMIWSVLDLMVLSAMGSTSKTEYYPIGINDDLSKPLPSNIQGQFCGFIQSPPNGTLRISITPTFNLDWEVGLLPLLQFNAEFLNSMRTLIVANQTPIIKVDPEQQKGNFEIVKEEIRKGIKDILQSWESMGKQKAILLPSGASIEFPQINFESFNQIQTIIGRELSKLTGLTVTYLLGEQANGLNATGDNDHLQNIKMFKVYGKQYALPLLQQLIPILDISLVEKKDLLNIQYYKTVEELDVAFNYLQYLTAISINFKDKDERRKKLEDIILGLFE